VEVTLATTDAEKVASQWATNQASAAATLSSTSTTCPLQTTTPLSAPLHAVAQLAGVVVQVFALWVVWHITLH
jgi:hypothetical protein